jgi:hypothetical protein
MKEKFPSLFWITLIVLALGLKAWTSYGEKKWAAYKRSLPQASNSHPRSQSSLPPLADNSGPENRSTGKVDFEPYSGYSEELFASRLISMTGRKPSKLRQEKEGEAPRYGISGTIGVIVRNVRKGEKYTVEISADRLIGSSAESFVIREDAGVVVICPQLNYDYVGLRRNTQTSFINISFKVLNESQTEGLTVTRRWQVHQINDCPIQLEHRSVMQDGSMAVRSSKQSWVIAGYVNENHPWIDALLLEAKNTGICDEFVGYSGGKKKIGPQIAAIWKALQNRGLTYSSIATTTSSNYHSFQHVRFLDQSISSTQANCLDGSVLLCSMLRKIGLNVGIVLVPGHAYVCVFDETDENWIFGIETTLLGKADLSQAMRMATENAQYALAKWNDATTDSYDLVDITKLRKDGIYPIPFDEVPAAPSSLTQVSIEDRPSPEDAARQQRIVIANRLRQKVIDLQANINQRKSEQYRVEAFNLFDEIRKHQSAFNSLLQKPSLKPTGVQSADAKMQDKYSEAINTLRNQSITLSTEINEDDLATARVVADALLGLASLPLNF